MDTLPNKLQENMVARLCHDLANDLGSLQLGLDNLLEVTKRSKSSDVLQDKITNGLKSSTNAALAKHAYYRVAYGNAESLEGAGFAELKKIIDRYTDHEKVHFTHADIAEDIKMSTIQAKLLLNIYGLAVEMLPFGGEIHLCADQLPCFELKGEKVHHIDLNAALTPRTAHLHYCAHLAGTAGLKLVQTDGEKMTLSCCAL